MYSEKGQQAVISDVDYQLEGVGLPSYSLLLSSIENATAMLLSQKHTEEKRRTFLNPRPAIQPRSTNQPRKQITRLENETLAEYISRYVEENIL